MSRPTDNASKPALLLFSLLRWDDEFHSTPKSLALELRNYFDVFFINFPLTLKDTLTGKRKRMAGQEIYPNLHVSDPSAVIPINWINNQDWYEKMRRINEKIVYRHVRELLRTHGIQKYYFLNSFAPFYGLSFPDEFKPILDVYQSVDDMSQSAYIGKHGPGLEQRYASKADMVLTTSQQLTDDLHQFNSTVHLVPNAANFELFNTAITGDLEKPDDLISSNSNVVTYIGNICDRLNYDLLLPVIESLTDITFLFIGPVTSADEKLSAIRKLKNTLFVGPKSLNDLPAYLKYSSCGIIPFKLNALTSRIYPLKVNEYLSAGLPVISTKFSKDIADFQDIIKLPSSETEFISAIRESISENSDEKISMRVARASRNQWKNRAEQIRNLLLTA